MIMTVKNIFSRARDPLCPLIALAILTVAGAGRGADDHADAPAPKATASSGTAGGEDVHALDAIVVAGSRTERPLGEAPIATEIITREEIEASGAQNVGEGYSRSSPV